MSFSLPPSMLGGYFASRGAQADLLATPASVRHFLAQVLLYGQTPTPSYGFIASAGNEAWIFLAVLLFMGICWLLTFAVEAVFYARKNPLLPRSTVLRCTALVNIGSYGLLAALWLPYSYHSARSDQTSLRQICSRPNSGSHWCPDIWARFPETREQRLASCTRLGIPDQRCFPGTN